MEFIEINIAFQMLLEEMSSALNSLNEEGSEFFRMGDYKNVTMTVEKVSQIQEFHKKVNELFEEWTEISPMGTSVLPQNTLKQPDRNDPNELYEPELDDDIDQDEEKTLQQGHQTKRLQNGLKTPRDAFKIPLLQALSELGGRGKSSEIIVLVGRNMRSSLTTYDFESLPSNSKSIRWVNTLQWCRKHLIDQELLKKNSPSGIWELSATGLEEIARIQKTTMLKLPDHYRSSL